MENIDEFVLDLQQLKPIQSKSNNIDFTCIGTNLSSCKYFQLFMKRMHEYNANKHNLMNTNDMLSTLNSFLHLIQHHNCESQFEYIFNELDHCDLNKCQPFRHNQRLKTKQHNIKDAAWQQIMDKMHCYFKHCYDIGNKLSTQDKQSIHNNSNNLQHELLKNSQIQQVYCILHKIREKFGHDLCSVRIKRNKQKYSQLIVNDESKQKQSEFGLYHFGYKFKYGYHGEDIETDTVSTLGFILVTAKYSSLEEEMLNNEICVLTKEQFYNEYKKAEVHFHSEYAKTIHARNGMWTIASRSIDLEQLLSVMIYCNYTDLQFKFSKTCRDFVGCSTFYHLGKNIKCAIFAFGTESKDGIVQALYHGIGEQLVLPQYIGADLDIFTPLSTTSSFVVAINFTNVNNGLIIEFGNFKQKWKDSGSSRYLSVSWLS
eukprot:432911_1